MFNVVTWHQIATRLSRYRVPLIPRILDYAIRLIYSCWFPHGVRAGERLVLGYGGLGVVIHHDVRLGDDVHIDQGVTIGGNGTDFGVPSIGNRVYIGAGAKILGPITVGDGSVIGANSVIVHDIPPRSLVVGVPGRVIRNDIEIQSFLYHRRQSASQ